jgi:GNAT superfamily N-acetyltransferase
VDEIVIRAAREDETEWMVAMIRRMVEEMARYGGHAPATAEFAWAGLARTIADQIKSNDAQYLIAESAQHEPVGVVGAELETLGGAFAPKKSLHLSVVYVLPPVRGTGIGSRLLTAILAWGRARGCAACNLNVVARNPARSLYEKHGFSVFEFKMVRPL